MFAECFAGKLNAFRELIGGQNATDVLFCSYFGQKKLKSESAAEYAAGEFLHVN